MIVDNEKLKSCIGKTLELRFHDGEIVEAELLGVDLTEHHDIEYEVRKILNPSPARGYAVTVGGTYVGRLDELESWRVLEII